MGISAFISGCEGLRLSERERTFFAAARPWGFILFARNIDHPEQVRVLVDEMRHCVGRANAPVLIDQEGGRVRRLRPPYWPQYPSGRRLGDLYRNHPETGLRAAWLQSRLIAFDLAALGINVDCLPVLDAPVESAHDAIGDRAYSSHPHEVAKIGRAACEGLFAGGVLPVIKHMPGHGRASVDSHHETPVVDVEPGVLGCTDFYPFMQLADMPMAMTAHVVYSGFDADRPATQSSIVIDDIIRGWIGFDGVLFSDDLSMNALGGDIGARTRLAMAAGCDIALHCNGVFAEMEEVAANCPPLKGKPAKRARMALARLTPPDGSDEAALRDEFSAMQAGAVQ